MTDRVEREAVVSAPPHEVWRVVLGDGWLADHVTIDPTPGGEARFSDQGRERAGWVEDAQAPRRLVFWWEAPAGSDSRVELTLTPEGEGTRIRVVETRPLDLLDVVGVPLPGHTGQRQGPAMLAAA